MAVRGFEVETGGAGLREGICFVKLALGAC